MRIAVNGLAITHSMTGIGRTTLLTLRAMLRRNQSDEFVCFLPRDAPTELGLEADNLELVHTGISLSRPLKSLLFEEIGLPLKLRGARIDLHYAPSFLLPAFPGAAAEVICVHDLAWRLFPKTKSLLFRAYMNRRLPAALKRAARIVCVSQATADDLAVQYPKAPRERVRVVHNGVDLDVFAPEPAAEPGEFITVVGNQDRRKNLGTLLEAFPLFRARMRPCRLVMVGPGNPPPRPPAAVDFLGYLEEDQLASLYRRSLMVVQPSLYEGFGLPVLEAMACGSPVACADIPAFREVAGDCAEYFDPENSRSIAATMGGIARDPVLRARLARAGNARAAGFSWDETARKLLEVFEEAVA